MRLFSLFTLFFLNRKRFLLYQTVYRDLKTFSGFPAQFCLHLSEKPHLHSLFATFTESRHLCLLFQRFQAVFPLFNALFPLQSRSFSAFTFYRSFTPYLIAATGDLSRYTPLSVAMPIGRAIRPYSRKIQAESGIKKPSRQLRPFFTHLSSFKALSTFSADVLHFFVYPHSRADHYTPS